MTKNIKQIQEENRKIILEAEFRDNKAWSKDDQENLIAYFIKSQKERTLAHTLFALGKIKADCGLFYISNGLVNFITTDNGYSFEWNLGIETLEEQSEETQIAINHLLNSFK